MMKPPHIELITDFCRRVMSTGRKCLRLDAQDLDEIEKIGGE